MIKITFKESLNSLSLSRLKDTCQPYQKNKQKRRNHNKQPNFYLQMNKNNKNKKQRSTGSRVEAKKKKRKTKNPHLKVKASMNCMNWRKNFYEWVGNWVFSTLFFSTLLFSYSVAYGKQRAEATMLYFGFCAYILGIIMHTPTYIHELSQNTLYTFYALSLMFNTLTAAAIFSKLAKKRQVNYFI